MRTSSIAALLICVGLIAQPAAADDVKGVTLDEVETALSVGFLVQRATTDDGDQFLVVQGKNHIIAVQVMTCGGDPVCSGVRYFSILKNAPSAEAVNSFNLDVNYSKVALSKTGKAVISIDHYVGGGVMPQNLLRTGAILMASMTKLGETQNIAAGAKPAAPALLSFEASWTNEGFAKELAGLRTFGVDPVLARLLVQEVDGAR